MSLSGAAFQLNSDAILTEVQAAQSATGVSFFVQVGYGSPPTLVQDALRFLTMTHDARCREFRLCFGCKDCTIFWTLGGENGRGQCIAREVDRPDHSELHGHHSIHRSRHTSPHGVAD